MEKKRVAILTLLLISYAYAQSISIDFPSDVFCDEEFVVDVELSDFSEGIYDLKFEIMNSSQNIAKVFRGNQWKSTHYWINTAYNYSNDNSFKLMITENYEGINNFLVNGLLPL